jgi:hypothetical protein
MTISLCTSRPLTASSYKTNASAQPETKAKTNFGAPDNGRERFGRHAVHLFQCAQVGA